MAKDPESYQYSPIIDDDGIRLIQLQPSKHRNSIVQCELIYTRLRTIKQDLFEHYTALSYVWGDATQTTQIMVGKKTLEVTKSLDSALRHLRDEMRVLNVWADGVCINQKDETGEKGRQVQQMGKVYETADHTVIFLGECDAKTEESLSHIVASFEEHTEDSNLIINQNVRSTIDELLGRPWFRRVWVYQELVMSSDPWVQYGRVRFPWSLLYHYNSKLLEDIGRSKFSELEDYARFLQDSTRDIVGMMEHSRSRFLITKLQPLRPTHHSQSARRGDSNDDSALTRMRSGDAKYSEYTKLLGVLVLRRGFEASDSRDMVFSVLGLSNNINIRADYGLAVTDVYHAVAWGCLDSSMSLEIFRHVHDAGSSEHMEGLASWAPDWTVSHRPKRRIHIKPNPIDYTYRPLVVFPEQYIAARNSFDMTWSLEKFRTLRGKAYQISKVRQLSSIIENLPTNGEGIFRDNWTKVAPPSRDATDSKGFWSPLHSPAAFDTAYIDWWPDGWAQTNHFFPPSPLYPPLLRQSSTTYYPSTCLL